MRLPLFIAKLHRWPGLLWSLQVTLRVSGGPVIARVTLQDEATVEIRGRRAPLWRVYDVFWMLHIMDHRARDDVNHPLLVGSAAVARFLAASGAWPAVAWLRRRRRRRRRG